MSTLNDDWLDAAKARLDLMTNHLMRARHGAGPEGKRCKQCAHLIEHYAHRKFFKCTLHGVSMSAATDWRANRAACGKFEMRGATDDTD